MDTARVTRSGSGFEAVRIGSQLSAESTFRLAMWRRDRHGEDREISSTFLKGLITLYFANAPRGRD